MKYEMSFEVGHHVMQTSVTNVAYDISNNVNHLPGMRYIKMKLSEAKSAGRNSEEILKALRRSKYHNKSD